MEEPKPDDGDYQKIDPATISDPRLRKWYEEHAENLTGEERKALDTDLTLAVARCFVRITELRIEWLKNLATLSSAGLVATIALAKTVIPNSGIVLLASLVFSAFAILASLWGMLIGTDRIENIVLHEATKFLVKPQPYRDFDRLIYWALLFFILAVITLVLAVS